MKRRLLSAPMKDHKLTGTAISNNEKKLRCAIYAHTAKAPR